MDVWELAQRCVQLAGPRATPNKGLKSPAYTELRKELVSCCGQAWARELIREAFAERYPGKPAGAGCSERTGRVAMSGGDLNDSLAPRAKFRGFESRGDPR
jgi:hypothetical protein